MDLKIHVFDKINMVSIINTIKSVLSIAIKYATKISLPISNYIAQANQTLAPPSTIKNLIRKIRKGGTN